MAIFYQLIKQNILAFLFCLCFLISPSLFSTINVVNEEELARAISVANNAPDTINFTANITLTAPLPLITNTYPITGGGFILDGGGAQQGFLIASGGHPRLSNLTIQNVSGQTARAFSIDSTSSLTLIATTNPFINSRATERIGTDIFLASGGSLTFIIPSGTFTLSNPIESDTLLATGGVTKSGAGTLNLGTLANNHRGTTSILEGTVSVGADSALGHGSAGLILGGGTLQGDKTFVSPRDIALLNTSSINLSKGINLTLSGIISGTGALTGEGTGVLTFLGANTYSGTTTVSGGGTLVLRGSSSTLGNYSPLTLTLGTFDISGGGGDKAIGTLDGSGHILLGANSLTLTGGSYSGIISGTGGITHSGASPLTLSGRSTYSGTTTLKGGGTLALKGPSSTLGNHSPLTLTSGTFDISCGGGDKTIGPLRGSGNIVLGTHSLYVPRGTHSGTIFGSGGIFYNGTSPLTLLSTNTYSGTTTISGGGTLILSGSSATLGTHSPLTITSGTFDLSAGEGDKTIGALSGGGKILLGANTLTVLSGAYGGVISGTGGLTHSGTSPLTLFGTNTYLGTTTVSGGGTLALSGVSSTLGASTALTLTSGTFDISLGGGNKTIGPLNGSGNILLGPHSLTLPEGSHSGIISGTGALFKGGTGTLTLLNTENTYSGGTTLLGGTLSVSTDGNMGEGNLTLSGGTLEATTSFATSKTLIITAPSTLSNTTPALLTLNGAINGTTGTLNKTGTGTVVFTALNPYTIPTILHRGTLRLKGMGTVGKGSALTLAQENTCFEIAPGAGTKSISTLSGVCGSQIHLSDNTLIIPSGSYSGVISGTGGLTYSGASPLTLSGGNTYSGTTLVSGGGTLTLLGASSSLGRSSPLTLTLGTFDISRGEGGKIIGALNGGGDVLLGPNSLTIQGGSHSGTLSGTGALFKGGTGTLTLLNTENTYSGGTTLSGGSLSVSTDGALGSGNLILNGGALETTASFATSKTLLITGASTLSTTGSSLFTLHGVISGIGGSLQKTGTGTLVLTAQNTYTVPTTLSGGTVRLKGAGTVGVESALTLAETNTLFEIAPGAGAKTIGVLRGVSGSQIHLTDNTLILPGGSYSGSISGTGGITHQGLSSLTLSGTNTYSGTTTVSGGGTLLLSGSSATLGNQSPLTLILGTFDISYGEGDKIIGPLTGSGEILLGSNSLIIQRGVHSGTISGTGGITYHGASPLTLLGANTYSGTTTISGGGTLTLFGASSSLGRSSPLTLTLGTFDISCGEGGKTIGPLTGSGEILLGPNSLTIQSGSYSGIISGTGGITYNGASSLTLLGRSTYTGTTTVNGGGTLALKGVSSTLGKGSPLTLTSGTFDISCGEGDKEIGPLSGGGEILLGENTLTIPSGTYSGIISGNGGITYNGTSLLTLSGASTYSGTTTISGGGTLSLSGASSTLGNHSALFLSSGTFDISYGEGGKTIGALSGGGNIALGTNSLTILSGSYHGILSGAGALFKSGKGTLTLFNKGNTFFGGTILLEGTLSVSADANLGYGNLTLSGGTLETTTSFATSKRLTITAPSSLLSSASSLLTLSGAISAVAGALNKHGPGTLILTAANTYTVPTILHGGTLRLTEAGTVGRGSALTLAQANTLFEIAPGAGTKSLRALNGVCESEVHLNENTLNIDSGSYSGVISGRGGLNHTSPLTLTLSGKNTYSGTTTISGGGTLALAGPSSTLGNHSPLMVTLGTFDISRGEGDKTIGTLSGRGNILLGTHTLTIPSGVHSGSISGTGGITYNGTSPLTLSGASTYSGETTISGGGTLALLGNASTLGNHSPLRITAGTFDISNGGDKNGGDKNEGDKTIGTLTGEGNILLGSHILTIQGGCYKGLISGTGGIEIREIEIREIEDRKIEDRKIEDRKIEVIRPTTLKLLNKNNTFSGGMRLSSGMLSVDHSGEIGTGTLFLSGGTLETTLPLTLSNPIKITAPSALFNGDSLTLLLSGVISGDRGALTKKGEGTVVFNAANTYTVPTILYEGTLRLEGAGTVGKNAMLTLTGANTLFEIAAGAGPKTIGVLSGIDSSQIRLSNNTLTIQSGDYKGTISGSCALIHSGPGTLILSNNANTYSGGTILTGGTLLVSVEKNLGTGNLTLSGGTLATTHSLTHSLATSKTLTITAPSALSVPKDSVLTLSGAISGTTGSLTKKGAGTLLLTAPNPYTVPTILRGGTLRLEGRGTVGNGGALTLAGAKTLFEIDKEAGTQSIPVLKGVRGSQIKLSTNTLNIGGGSYHGSISGRGRLNHTSTAPLTLFGTNTYSGTTTISGGGTLALEGSSSTLGNNAPLNITSGTFDISRGEGDKTIGPLRGSGTIVLGANTLLIPGGSHSGSISGTGGITHASRAPLTFLGAKSYSGTTTISGGGILSLLGASSTLGNSSPLTLTSGTFNIAGGEGDKTIGPLSGEGNILLGTNTLLIPSGSYHGSLSGSGGIIHSGSACLTLFGTNTYSGPTTISGGGTLSLSGSSSTLVPSSALKITSGTFDISRGEGNKTLNMLKGTGMILLGANTLSIQKGSYYGIISGTGGVNYIGITPLTLLGTNTYSGPTTISGGGTLLLSGSSSSLSPSSALTITSGTFDISRGEGDKTIGPLSGEGEIFLGANSLFVPSGAYRGIISGTGGIIHSSPSPLTFSGNHLYTGTTTISGGGTLALSGPTATLGNLSALNILSGTFVISSGTKTIGTLTGGGDGIDLNDSNLRISSGDFSGPIRGKGSVTKITKQVLTLSGASTYTGGTTLSGGILRMSVPSNLGSPTSPLTFEGGTLEPTTSITSLRPIVIKEGAISIRKGVTHHLKGLLSGSGPLLKLGPGTLILSGNANHHSGVTTLFEGQLFLQNSCVGPITILPGAILAGNGRVGTVHNAGTISPGTSIGTKNINGALHLSPSSVLDMEITPSGRADLIHVTGSATLDGTLRLLPTDAPFSVYLSGTRYTIISANTIQNQFKTPPPLPYLTQVNGGDVIVSLNESFLVINPKKIERGNPRQVASYLASCQDPQGDLLTVLTALEALDMKSLNDALNQLCPARFGALALNSFHTDITVSKIFADSLKNRDHFHTHSPLQNGKNSWEVWITPFASWNHQNRREQQRAFHTETAGGVLGGDYTFTNTFSVGGGVGYSRANMSWEQHLGQSVTKTIYWGVYSNYLSEHGFIQLSLAVARNFYRSNRRLLFPGLDRTAHNHHKGWDLISHLSGGLEIPTIKALSFQPTLDIDYIHLFQGKFQERHGKSISLAVKPKHSACLRTTLALNLTKTFKRAQIRYAPSFLIGWVHETYLHSSHYQAKMTDPCLTDPCLKKHFFITETFHKSQDRQLIGGNFRLSHQKGVALLLSYQGEFDHHSIQHEGRAQIKWDF